MQTDDLIVVAGAISLLLSIASLLAEKHLTTRIAMTVKRFLPLGGHDVVQVAVIFFVMFSMNELIIFFQ